MLAGGERVVEAKDDNEMTPRFRWRMVEIREEGNSHFMENFHGQVEAETSEMWVE